MVELSSRERARLRSEAHAIAVAAHVGKAGLTASVVRQVDEALLAHPLVKVKLAGDREARAATARELVERTGATLVDTIGRIVILFRPPNTPS